MEMKDTTTPSKDDPTQEDENRNKPLPDAPEEVDDAPEAEGSAVGTANEEMIVSRRSVLMSGGAVAGILAGWGIGFTDNVQAQSVESFGYGGTPIMQQSAQTVTVAESEPNDRRTNAMEVSLGTSITASLTSNDSDWYAVELSSGDEPVVTFDRKAKSGISALVFFGPGGSLRNLRYIPDDQPLTFKPAVDDSGTHYFQVVDTQDSASDYSLTIETESDEETSTPTPTPTETATADEYGEQAYGEYGYGGVPVQ
jgi:hypothetical protein